MINLGCGLYTGFPNIILDFHGLRVELKCGLYTVLGTLLCEKNMREIRFGSASVVKDNG